MAKEFASFLDLTGKGRVLECKYHGAEDLFLEAVIFEEKDEGLVVGISLLPEEVAYQKYSPRRRSLDTIYSPTDVIVAGLHFERIATPKNIQAINVYDDIKFYVPESSELMPFPSF